MAGFEPALNQPTRRNEGNSVCSAGVGKGGSPPAALSPPIVLRRRFGRSFARTECEQTFANVTKIGEFSRIVRLRTSFGTRGSQVQILPLRPESATKSTRSPRCKISLLPPSIEIHVPSERSPCRRALHNAIQHRPRESGSPRHTVYPFGELPGPRKRRDFLDTLSDREQSLIFRIPLSACTPPVSLCTR